MKILPLLPFFTLIMSCMNCLNAEIVKILIQGDTQKIINPDNGKQDNFVPFMAKILTDPITKDADFILQMGDIVESDKDNSDRPQQYAVAREGWRQLDGKIPYVLNLGNNDHAEEYFAVFGDLDAPLHRNHEGTNFAYSFNAGKIDWLVISLKFKSSPDDHNWMEEVIEMHPDKKVILIKHEVNANSGVVKRLKKYSNVVLVLSGHTRSQKALLTGDNGNKIGWIRTCHHNANLDSYFRVLLVDTVRGTVSSSFYSPQYERFWHDPIAPYHDCDRSTPWTFAGFDFGVDEPSSIIEGNDAEFTALEKVPCCIITSENFSAVAVVENTGTTKWDASLQQNKYKLGSENPMNNRTWGAETHQTPIYQNVMPGERHRFEIECKAPLREGLYNFQLRMVQYGAQWFGDFSENRIIYVASNKVVSGSFENSNIRSAVWMLGSSAHWTNKDKRSGDSALAVNGKSTATQQTVLLEKNTEYTISVWAKRGDDASGHITFDTWDAFDKPGEGQFVIKTKKIDDWTKFSGSFNSGEKDSVTIRIFTQKLTGTVYFDDVVIKPRASGKVDFAYKNMEYNYEINATGFDNNSLEYGYNSLLPDWLNFDSETGTLTGTPKNKDIGIHAASLYVKDANKKEDIALLIRALKTPPFTQWCRVHSIKGEVAENDQDKDGLADLLEFALGSDPKSNDAASNRPKLLTDNTEFNFTFRRNQATLTYAVKESVDLENWSDCIIINDAHGAIGDTCTVALPASENKRFFKLEVRQ